MRLSLSTFRILAWIGSVTCLVIVVLGSLLPTVAVPSSGGSDKVLDLIAYASLSACALSTAPLSARRVVAVVLLCMLLGALIELVQPFVGREAGWLDAAANVLGALCGWPLARLGWRLCLARAL